VRGPEYRRDASGSYEWYVYDGLGSVIGTVDNHGVLLSTRKYDVYGGVRGSSGPSGTRHKFVGKLGHPSDDETGLIYMRARYYDPVTGRFESEDPSGNGINWYVYCSNNPVNKIDPTGLVTLGEVLTTELLYDYIDDFREMAQVAEAPEYAEWEVAEAIANWANEFNLNGLALDVWGPGATSDLEFGAVGHYRILFHVTKGLVGDETPHFQLEILGRMRDKILFSDL